MDVMTIGKLIDRLILLKRHAIYHENTVVCVCMDDDMEYQNIHDVYLEQEDKSSTVFLKINYTKTQ